MYKYFLKKENVMKLLHNNQIDNAYLCTKTNPEKGKLILNLLLLISDGPMKIVWVSCSPQLVSAEYLTKMDKYLSSLDMKDSRYNILSYPQVVIIYNFPHKDSEPTL